MGVTRQYSGTLGKIGNCQVAVSLNYATADGGFPVDFQLYLPQSWSEDQERRRRAGIPAEVTFKTKWQLGLAMLDQAQAWGLPKAVMVTDAGYGVATEFRQGLQERGYHYVVGITSELTVWTEPVTARTPRYSGRGRPPNRDRILPKPFKVSEAARRLPESAWQEITWRQGTKGFLRGRFAALRAQPAPGYHQGKVTEPVCWLLIEWPPGADAPENFWFSSLPESTDLQELVYCAKIRWWVEQNYQQLKDELGLDHFEWRSWDGWHHHVTLTMMALAFLVLEGFRAKKNFWVDLAPGQAGTTAHDFSPTWFLPELLPPIYH